MKFGRVAGFDDGYFRRPGKAPLVATIFKGSTLEGIEIAEIEVDGTDATDRILEIVEPLKEQLTGVFLYGTVFAGTNVVDLRVIADLVPVVAVVGKRPTERFARALALRGKKTAQHLVPLATKKGIVYAAWAGLSRGEAKKMVELYQLNSKIPEPLRVAHIIAKGVGLFLNG